jgi:predicted Zn-dependent protease with MMP-like domain
MNLANWEALRARAQLIIDCTIAELPPQIRAEAQKVPCLFQQECEDDPEILGSYGHFELGEVSPAKGPIILYLVTITDYCDDEDLDFDSEVRLTYLHELGHHLGWDEEDLEARGLE